MSQKRILIVEDDKATLSLLSTILGREGHEVIAAGTVSEGLALLEADPPPDCIVLDLDLPDGRGEAVLRTIRERGLPVRVAVCTAMSDPDRWLKVQGLNPEYIMQKPVQIQAATTMSAMVLIGAVGIQAMGSMPKPASSPLIVPVWGVPGGR